MLPFNFKGELTCKLYHCIFHIKKKKKAIKFDQMKNKVSKKPLLSIELMNYLFRLFSALKWRKIL